MLTILATFLGVSITQTINYRSNYTPQIKQQTEIVEEVEPAPTPIVEEYDPVKCSCVIFASQFLDLPKNTDAIDLKPNNQPAVGNGILFNYNGVGHIAIITGYKENGFLVKESNYNECKISTRVVSFNDKSIVGFIK